MARFLSFYEIKHDLITSREQITRLAEKIMVTPRFQSGRCVVFGSVVWDTHTWRSDIDVADGSLKDGMGTFSGEIRKLFEDEFGGEHGSCVFDNLVQELRNEKEGEIHYHLPEISPSTMDHFRLLAKIKGGPWKKFYEQIVRIVCRSRITDIQLHTSTIWRLWFNLDYSRDSIWKQNHIYSPGLATLSAIENFPKQLIRKILGKEKKLPSPDTFENILLSFQNLDRPWVPEILLLFNPFFAIGKRYDVLVNKMRGDKKATEVDYIQELKLIFSLIGLNVEKIKTIIENAYTQS